MLLIVNNFFKVFPPRSPAGSNQCSLSRAAARQHSLSRTPSHPSAPPPYWQSTVLGPERSVLHQFLGMCVATYVHVVVLSQAHPELVVSRLAYMRNIVWEANRFGGDGWRTYDYVFRSQAAANTCIDWTTTNPSLMLIYMKSCNHHAFYAMNRTTTRPHVR